MWCVQKPTSRPYWLCVTLPLGLLFWWGWPVTEMAVEGGKISLRKDGKRKVMVNKRLLIWVPCVVCPGNIKVIPFLVRSDQGSLPVCPLLSSMFVMPKYPGLQSFKKRLEAEWCFVSLCLCLCLFLFLSPCPCVHVCLCKAHCVEIRYEMWLCLKLKALWCYHPQIEGRLVTVFAVILFATIE